MLVLPYHSIILVSIDSVLLLVVQRCVQYTVDIVDNGCRVMSVAKVTCAATAVSPGLCQVSPSVEPSTVSNTQCNYCCLLCSVVCIAKVTRVSKVTCAASAVSPGKCQVSPPVGSNTLAIILGVTIGSGVLLVVVITVTVAVVCHRMKGSKLKVNFCVC
jgi:hypothetical protein